MMATLMFNKFDVLLLLHFHITIYFNQMDHRSIFIDYKFLYTLLMRFELIYRTYHATTGTGTLGLLRALKYFLLRYFLSKYCK